MESLGSKAESVDVLLSISNASIGRLEVCNGQRKNSIFVLSLLLAGLSACGGDDVDPRTLSRMTDLPPNANCPQGEIRTQTGIDANQNGLLEASEVVTDVYGCSTNNGLGGDDRLFGDL